MSNIHWGNIFVGGGTVSAVVFSVGLSLLTERRRARDAEAAQFAEARSVVLSITDESDTRRKYQTSWATEVFRHHGKLRIHNISLHAITDVSFGAELPLETMIECSVESSETLTHLESMGSHELDWSVESTVLLKMNECKLWAGWVDYRGQRWKAGNHGRREKVSPRHAQWFRDISTRFS